MRVKVIFNNTKGMTIGNSLPVCLSFTCLLGSTHWPAGSYGIPKAASGCPGANGFHWLIGRRYQDTEDSNPNNHKSPQFHLDATVDSKRGIIRSFCMKTDTSTDMTRGSWPSGTKLQLKLVHRKGTQTLRSF